VKREQLTFLAVGFAFGALFGAALLSAFSESPDLAAASAGGVPSGSAAPAAGAPAQGGGGAPMMAEIRALRKQIADDPQDSAAIVRLAHLYHDVQMWDDAIGYYEMALEIDPQQPDLLTDMGICYRGKQEYDTALELFNRASALDPAHWQSLFNVVVVAGFDLKQFETARAALNTMQQMDPLPPRLDELSQALDQAEAGNPEG
jgi:cytochrome c-type biogenesis protein CcmH/NrfG